MSNIFLCTVNCSLFKSNIVLFTIAPHFDIAFVFCDSKTVALNLFIFVHWFLASLTKTIAIAKVGRAKEIKNKKIKQRRLRTLTLQWAKVKCPILLSQYWEKEEFDNTKSILHFGCTNNIFVNFMTLYSLILALMQHQIYLNFIKAI